jgi:phosphate uptake regulator
MDIRKVQVTGGSSFVITLPKDWAESMHIKKNDPLGVYVQSDGTLLITRNTTESQVQRVKKIDITAITDPQYLFRLLIGAYIAGYSVIQITGKGRFPTFVHTVVRDFAQMTIGFEVMEESESGVLLKDLLNPMEMPLENSVKRMYVIVKNMFADAITALETRNIPLAQDVIARDNDVDRLHWLIERQANIVLKNPAISRKIGVKIGEVVNTSAICRIIERIGDHAVREAENAIRIIEYLPDKGSLDAAILEKIQAASKLSLALFDRSIVSFFKADIRGSNRNIESVGELERTCEEINTLARTQDIEIAIALRNMAESIRRAGEYSGDISENVINYLVEEKI